MPKQVLPDRADFERIRAYLLGQGFKSVLPVRMRQELRGFRFVYPRGSRPGPEHGFVFAANGYAVYVWTTWLVRENQAREEDAGWVLITEAGKRRYVRPVHRTRNFVDTLLNYAWIAKFRVANRPNCEVCRKPMRIVYGRVRKQRLWACFKRRNHLDREPRFLSWDHGLPPKAMAFLKRKRKARKPHQERRKAAGKPINVAPLRRRPRAVPVS